jgi:hypothetical protein
MSSFGDVEKNSLDAHVEICAIRYKNLEEKLENLDSRIDKLEEHVVAIKDSLSNSDVGNSKQLITIGTTIIGVLLTAVFGLVTHLLTK